MLTTDAMNMTIDTQAIVTATEANQNFSKAAKLAEQSSRSREYPFRSENGRNVV
jgi:hypothetical protein